jgi:hypothetical protein
MRQKSRKDLNQTAIVKELRELGYDVDIVERPYDIVVSGRLYLWGHRGCQIDYCVPVSLRVEIKSEKGKLLDSQIEYHDKQIHQGSIIVAYKVEDIVEWFGRE